MKDYLKNIAHQLKNYSKSLDKISILIDKPWALIDNEFEMQKLIFKKNKELILSKNGQVQIGKWDYFPEAKALLIDRNVDKILCNEEFIDNGVMILKLDGTQSRFFILANENIIPNLDAIEYLNKLRFQKLNIIEQKLVDGRIIEVKKQMASSQPILLDYVTNEFEALEDGIYQLDESNLDLYFPDKPKYYEINKSRIFKILFETKYINPHGLEIHIQQQNAMKITYGDYIYKNGEKIEDAVINFSKNKNLIVRNGFVLRLERKNAWARWFAMIGKFGYED